MAKPRVYKTEAIVLKRTNLGEADSIITLYTPNLGKIRAVAKGVRRPKSKLGGHLDLLTQSALLLAHGQNLDIITQSQTMESFAVFKKDLQCIGCAMYIAELVDQFTAEQSENYSVYKLLQATLLWLGEARDKELVLRCFEMQLLNCLGYKPELQDCPLCRISLTPKKNYFSVGDGGVLCPECAESRPSLYPLTVDALKVLRFIINNDRSTVNRLRIDADLSQELEQVTRGYIRYILEREVRSVDFLDHLKREGISLEQAGC